MPTAQFSISVAQGFLKSYCGYLNMPFIANGTSIWYKSGWVHRENDHPAVIWNDGSKAWYRYGKLHREEGPAFIDSSGFCEYWKNGKMIVRRLD